MPISLLPQPVLQLMLTFFTLAACFFCSIPGSMEPPFLDKFLCAHMPLKFLGLLAGCSCQSHYYIILKINKFPCASKVAKPLSGDGPSTEQSRESCNMSGDRSISRMPPPRREIHGRRELKWWKTATEESEENF